MDLYLASNNPGKLKELKGLLEQARLNIKVHSANAHDRVLDVEESAETFEGNALLKAQAMLKVIPKGRWVLADDSGLEVDGLSGKPGVRSARYAGENATAVDNNRKLLNALKGIPTETRTARFVCALVLLDPSDQQNVFRGVCEGSIQDSLAGNEGFGYDPLFVPKGYDRTFAELGSGVKDKVSHRALALRSLIAYLAKLAS